MSISLFFLTAATSFLGEDSEPELSDRTLFLFSGDFLSPTSDSLLAERLFLTESLLPDLSECADFERDLLFLTDSLLIDLL